MRHPFFQQEYLPFIRSIRGLHAYLRQVSIRLSGQQAICVAILPGNETLAVAGQHLIQIYNTTTGLLVNDVSFNTNGKTIGLCYSNKSERLIQVRENGEILALNTRTRDGEKIYEVKLDRFGLPIKAVILPNQDIVVVLTRLNGRDCDVISIWNMANGIFTHCWDAHFLAKDFEVSSDGQLIAAANSDGLIKVHHAQTGALKRTIHLTKFGPIGFLPNTGLIASSQGERIMLFDATTGMSIVAIDSPLIKNKAKQVLSVGKELVVLNGPKVYFFDVPKWVYGTADSSLQSPCTKDHVIAWVAMSPKKSLVVGRLADGSISIWNIETGQCQQVLPAELEWTRGSVALISPDHQAIITGVEHTNSKDRLRLWDLAKSKLRWRCTLPIRDVVAWSPGADFLVTRVWFDSILILSPESGCTIRVLDFKPSPRIFNIVPLVAPENIIAINTMLMGYIYIDLNQGVWQCAAGEDIEPYLQWNPKLLCISYRSQDFRLRRVLHLPPRYRGYKSLISKSLILFSGPTGGPFITIDFDLMQLDRLR